jgi:DNA (cytosine-5)-methyltransferase 1
MMLRMGSLFSGIGGLELGLERAFKGQLQTAWQVEKESFCRSVLERHWSNAKRYDDVRTVGAHNLEPVDILCGGFPCQDISIAGKGEGLNGKRSGLWWEFHRIINELRPSVVVMENVPAITIRGLSAVVGSLAQIGYDCQWTIISAKQCGAPHLRRRWFCVAYPISSTNTQVSATKSTSRTPSDRYTRTGLDCSDIRATSEAKSTANTNSQRIQEQPIWSESVGQERKSKCGSCQDERTQQNYWQGFPTQSPVRRRNDGVPNRVDRLKSLGNAVVPQCAEWVGQQIIKSNILGERYVRN